MRVTARDLATKGRRPRPRRERDVQRAILDYLGTLPNVWAWRSNTGAVTEGKRFVRFGLKGQADITGWITHTVDGVPIAQRLEIEVKGEAGKLRPEQADFLCRAHTAGVCVIVARNVDDVVRVLAALR